MSIFSHVFNWVTPEINFRLLPKQQLEVAEPDSKYDWQSTGDDPYFKLKRKGAMPKGWYMLNLCVDADISRLDTKFYVDYGQDIDEADALCVSLLSGKLNKRVMFFDGRPLSLRFDPISSTCKFSITKLSLTKLTSARARSLMLKKLQSRRSLGAIETLSQDDLLLTYNHCFDKSVSSVTYQQWRERHEAQFTETKAITPMLANLTVKPVFSVVMASYNSNIEYLKACIDSVLGQHYPHWQLCIADDASTNPEVKALLQQYSELDERIVWQAREVNGHISAASNSALALANGDYIALLDHDDMLAPHALLMMAEAVNESPNAELFYSDEDKIDEQGNRRQPHFKPDWNRDLFYSHNYITHLAVLKTSLIHAIEGFREKVEGSQDYDLILRAVARLGNKQIIHVPHILYHWRAVQGSTALSAGEKDYTSSAGLKALKDYFNGTNIPVKVNYHNLNNSYKVTWPLPEPKPLVSLIIPTRDGYELLKKCISSIINKTHYPHYEILVLNNQTQCVQTLEYFELLKQKNRARIIDFDEEFNFSNINNLGVQHAKGSIVGLINNDIEVLNAEWLEEMVCHASRPDIGCVGAKLYYPDMRIQHAGVILGIGGVAGHAHKYFGSHHHGYHSRLSLVQNFSAVTAAALLVRKSVYIEVGGLEPLLKVAFNDVDFCLKVREAGYRNLWTPFAELIHHESVSRGYEDSPEKQQRFSSEVTFMKTKWGSQLTNDPCYNPNLTLEHEDFSYKV